ncbi:hypothetical protein ACVUTM_19705, partial [Escherichia coli]
DVFAGKKSAQIREILISESAWEEMTCLFAPSLIYFACNFFANNNRAEFNKSAANEKANFVAETTVKHILTLLRV